MFDEVEREHRVHGFVRERGDNLIPRSVDEDEFRVVGNLTSQALYVRTVRFNADMRVWFLDEWLWANARAQIQYDLYVGDLFTHGCESLNS